MKASTINSIGHKKKMKKHSVCLLILDSSNQDLQECGYLRSTVKENMRRLATSSVFEAKISARVMVPQYMAHLWGSRIIQELQGVEGIINVSKREFSALDGTTTLETLRKNKATHVCVCGTSTDTSVYETIGDLVSNCFDVLVVSDATTSKNGKRAHEDGLRKLVVQYGSSILINTDEIDVMLGGNGSRVNRNSASCSEPTLLVPLSHTMTPTFQVESVPVEATTSNVSLSMERKDPIQQHPSEPEKSILQLFDGQSHCENPEPATRHVISVAGKAADLEKKLRLRTPSPGPNLDQGKLVPEYAQPVLPMREVPQVDGTVETKAASLGTQLKDKSFASTLAALLAGRKESDDGQPQMPFPERSTKGESVMESKIPKAAISSNNEEEGDNSWEPQHEKARLRMPGSGVTLRAIDARRHSKPAMNHDRRRDANIELGRGYEHTKGTTSGRLRNYKTPKVMTDKRETWDRFGKKVSDLLLT